uniref:L,D-transpeptidase family protein n=1 Tax=Blastomonas sp. TaxID=1909299 RepID=UPI003593346E
WPIRAALFRPGRASPPSGFALPWRWTGPGDGWSDDPVDPAYNRPVRLPHAFSAETLQRADMLYDVIIVLGHNDAPPMSGAGSAIFFHLWDEARPQDTRSTEGCVAIARADMLALLPRLRPGMMMEIG